MDQRARSNLPVRRKKYRDDAGTQRCRALRFRGARVASTARICLPGTGRNGLKSIWLLDPLGRTNVLVIPAPVSCPAQASPKQRLPPYLREQIPRLYDSQSRGENLLWRRRRLCHSYQKTHLRNSRQLHGKELRHQPLRPVGRISRLRVCLEPRWPCILDFQDLATRLTALERCSWLKRQWKALRIGRSAFLWPPVRKVGRAWPKFRPRTLRDLSSRETRRISEPSRPGR